MYIGEEKGGLSKVNLRNGTVNLVKIISSCSLISININPIRCILVLKLIVNFNILLIFINIFFNRKNVIAMGTIQGEIYLSKYEL